MAYGMFLPDGNTLIPTSAFNAMCDELRNQFYDAYQVARDTEQTRGTRLNAARMATVCRRALRTLETHEFCRTQSRI